MTKSFRNEPAFLALRDICAERTQRLVFWVGSGLSAPAGLPTWRRLRDCLQAVAVSKAEHLESEDQTKQLARLHAVEGISDMWVAFDQLRTILGRASFVETIRGQLVPNTDDVPELYGLLWQLGPAGILNLNLDRFAARAFSEYFGAKRAFIEVTGRQASVRIRILKSPAPFLINLHGTIEDADSWVLTQSDFEALSEDAGYKRLIESIVATRVIVFVGISADDTAAGGFLARLAEQGIDFGSHYWLTHRSDRATDDWAEAAGIRVIRYSPSNDHQELHELAEELLAYVSIDPPAPPVTPSVPQPTSSVLASAEELSSKSPEEIRLRLNEQAASLLAKNPPELAQYDAFRDEYARAIHNAWFVSERAPDNVIFNHTLVRKIGEGAFGHVYEGRDPAGNRVAIKLLREAVMNTPDMLGSFRRGVRSMKILSQRNVEGMVPYRQAFELPACLVMDFVDGPDLEQVVYSGQLSSWYERLKVLAEISQIIRSGHQLPERVLHRDIRPANVMLRHYYHDPDCARVVVLDFDLSWHRDALEHSVMVSAPSALGYIAPEQQRSTEKRLTRNAMVDSFGLGMTAYFVCCGDHPKAGDHLRADWAEHVARLFARTPCPEWASTAARVARLVVAATRAEQSRRLDATQIESEFGRLVATLRNPEEVDSAELLSEEIAARAVPGEYEWDENALAAGIELPSRVRISVTAKEASNQVELRIGWVSAGDEDRRGLEKYVRQSIDKAVSVLREGGWVVQDRVKDGGALNVRAVVDTEAAAGRLDRLAEGVRRVGDALRMR